MPSLIATWAAHTAQDGCPACWLTDHSWSRDARDVCWLDCEEPGHIKYVGNRVICLCVRHAQLLEAGFVGGSYAGAPLPPESVAAEWPWWQVAA